MNNSKKCIHSFEVQHLCNDFLVFKRSLGFKYVSEEKILRYFTHYCEENHPNEILPEDIIYDWINNNPNNSLKTRSNHVSTITAWANIYFQLDICPSKFLILDVHQILHLYHTFSRQMKCKEFGI